jgi:hypothetical protein
MSNSWISWFPASPGRAIRRWTNRFGGKRRKQNGGPIGGWLVEHIDHD